MSLLIECDDKIHAKHRELCLELNMDLETSEISWKSYKEIRNNYTLDGEQIHWLCCALYVACRNSMTPTVGSGSFVEGNCVPLTRLLRICNISLNEFFKKMKKWAEMASMPSEFRCKISRLESSFAVSTVIYQKYGPIFRDLFICPSNDELRVGKGKKVKLTPCTANKVFELCWCLFVCAKGEYPKQSVDLVTSFHMLLCCADLVFANAIVDKRKDLINSQFPGIPAEWNSGEEITEPICVMSELCKNHEGTIVDAMETKQYTWNSVIKKFFEKKILKGDEKTYMGILSMGNFEHNLKSLNTLYETYTLSCGEFDERIFLNHKQFGSNNLGGSSMKDEIRTDLEKHFQLDESIKTLVKGTPFTRRDCLPGKNFLTPVATATQSVNKLRSSLTGYDGNAQASLRELFIQCGENPELKIVGWLNVMSKKFCEKFQTNAQERFHLAEALYYRLLENIIRAELKQRPNLSLKNLLNLEIFNTTLIVCCVEIVISAYNSQKKFPWVLECFQLDAFHFYKIIEMVVLYHHDHLTRDRIKHLNSIEEQALESLAWVSGSHLWDLIKQLQGPLPSWQDVEIPKQRDDDLSGVTPHNPDYRKSDETDKNSILMSPVSSATERFHQSPSKSTANAKVQLFKSPTHSNGESSTSSEQQQGTDTDSNQMDPTIINTTNSNSDSSNGSLVKKPNNRAGSLGLFFRKFYKLAYIRMKELCKELGFEEDLIKKIWTIFEYSIVERTELMRDRHLDQILMCAIYVFNRVTKLEKTFADIMKFYRNQPQSESHVYRSVLISETDNRMENNSGTEAPIPQIPPQPSDLAGTSTLHNNERRGDIIKFYNTVYVQKMQQFAMRFSNQAPSDDVPLSPIPRGRGTLISPKKVSANHSLFVHPMEHKELTQSPSSLTYSFSNSPAKDLEKMNYIIRNGKNNNNNGIKRNLPFDTDDILLPNKSIKINSTENLQHQQGVSFMTRKVQSLITDRQDNGK